MSNRLARTVFSPSFLSRNAGAGHLEQLEQRQMMSAQPLPQGTSLVSWGNGVMAAQTGSYIMEFDNAYGSQQAVQMAREAANRLGVSATDFTSVARGRYATFETTSPISRAQAQALSHSMSHLVTLEPNQVYQLNRVPNDTRFSEEYWLSNTGQVVQGQAGTIGADIHATQAWDLTIGSRSIVVANIDTGIDLTHPDLVPNLWRNTGETPNDNIDNDGNGFVDDYFGFDFGDSDSNPTDDSFTAGHGTETAGIIGAAGNNALGISGVNWNVSIMSLKVVNRNGVLTLAAVIGAHDYATMMINRGTNIVASNNSYGSYDAQGAYVRENQPNGSTAERDAIQRFVNTGATFVTAAGNFSFDHDIITQQFFPASYDVPGIISVAASDNNDTLAAFSDFGQSTVTLAAPGVSILTTMLGGTFGYADDARGTSYSSAMVAGAVALMQAYYASTHSGQNASATNIREALINGVDQSPSFQNKLISGGRLNVFRSMQLLNIAGPTVRAVTPGPVTGQLNTSNNQPVNTVTVTFSRDIDRTSLSTATAALVGDGADNTFGTGDDRVIPITSVARSGSDPRTVIITLNLSSFPQSRLPIDSYRLTLAGTGPNAIRDTNGNFLNGDSTGGANFTYNFRVISSTGDSEPNDTLATATAIPFDAAGQANFTGVTIGNGLAANLDVDLYRIDLARGGLITAEVTARRLPAPSTLDSYLRLFNASGVEITNNDQSFGQDSFIDFFVSTGGTYYIGVSGFGNEDYDPRVQGSGTSQSTGVYNLRIQVTPSTDDTITTPSQDGFPLRIPPQTGQTQGTTSSFITISDSRQVLDVNVRLDITHTFDQDLRISLVGPNNVTVLLVNGRGSNGQNFTNTVFDDEAPASITTAAPPFTGVFRPEQSLGAFDGLSAATRWTLVVDDQRSLNSGLLNSWSLTITYRNDTFGPFESNDTLATAKPINEVVGTGSANRNAFIGDGAFGNRDRDIYSFTADAGSSLSLTLQSPGSLDAGLRLFDAAGTQILSSTTNPLSGSLVIDNFVFANGGTYYLAVSEASNITYDPRVAASGVAATTTGNYFLSLTLAAGVSDPETTLVGSPLSVGLNTAGTFGTSGTSGAGLLFNGVDFLPSRTRDTFIGLVANGNSFVNSTTAPDGLNNTSNVVQLPFSLTASSDTANNRISARAAFRGLDISRTISYARNNPFVAIDVYFTNTSGSAFSDVAWAEGFNPDPGISLSETSNTSNDVDASAHIATAVYTNNQFGQGLTVALAAPDGDTRARATVVSSGPAPRDPGVLLSQPVNDPNGTSSDSRLVLTYDLGDIAPGATTSIRYFIFFGTTEASVETLEQTLNNGTGTGHLAADPRTPAPEVLNTGTGPAASVPTLPYKVYYPEGFFGDNIFTFVPISNMSDQAASVYVIAHYETGNRDQLVGQLTIGANARSGLTITTPELFRNGGTLAGRPNTPYSLEVRSDRPVAATFSHYDLGILGGHQAAIGESFTSVTDTSWSFAQSIKGLGGNTDFVVFYNPNTAVTKVTAFLYPSTGGPAFQTTFNVDAMRRSGFAVNDLTTSERYLFTQDYTLQVDYRVSFSNTTLGFTTNGNRIYAQGEVIPAGTVIVAGSQLGAGNRVPEGTYGINLDSELPIVASISHYNFTDLNAAGSIGNSGIGSLKGVIPEGQVGTTGGNSSNPVNSTVSVLNTSADTAASVLISFLFQDGSAYRSSLAVAPRSTASLSVADLPNFPTDQPYGVFFESNTPVVVNTLSRAFGDAESSAVADKAFSLWGFGEGFRPGDSDTPPHPGVIEQLRLYNPSNTATVVEITIGYDGIPGTETFRRTLQPRSLTQFSLDEFITGSRRLTDQFYGTRVKSQVPIVAYMDHYDRAFGGLVPDPVPGAAFGTLGTPLGISTPVT